MHVSSIVNTRLLRFTVSKVHVSRFELSGKGGFEYNAIQRRVCMIPEEVDSKNDEVNYIKVRNEGRESLLYRSHDSTMGTKGRVDCVKEARMF